MRLFDKCLVGGGGTIAMFVTWLGGAVPTFVAVQLSLLVQVPDV